MKMVWEWPMKLIWPLIVCLAVLALVPGVASAGMTYSFSNITATTTPGSKYQFTVFGQGDNVSAYTGLTVNAGQAAFVFQRPGSVGSITEVYFQDGTLLGIASVVNSSGVNFSNTPDATPNNPPGGNALPQNFMTTRYYGSLDA